MFVLLFSQPTRVPFLKSPCAIGKVAFKNILIRPSKLPGLLRKGPLNPHNTKHILKGCYLYIFKKVQSGYITLQKVINIK